MTAESTTPDSNGSSQHQGMDPLSAIVTMYSAVEGMRKDVDQLDSMVFEAEVEKDIGSGATSPADSTHPKSTNIRSLIFKVDDKTQQSLASSMFDRLAITEAQWGMATTARPTGEIDVEFRIPNAWPTKFDTLKDNFSTAVAKKIADGFGRSNTQAFDPRELSSVLEDTVRKAVVEDEGYKQQRARWVKALEDVDDQTLASVYEIAMLRDSGCPTGYHQTKVTLNRTLAGEESSTHAIDPKLTPAVLDTWIEDTYKKLEGYLKSTTAETVPGSKAQIQESYNQLTEFKTAAYEPSMKAIRDGGQGDTELDKLIKSRVTGTSEALVSDKGSPISATTVRPGAISISEVQVDKQSEVSLYPPTFTKGQSQTQFLADLRTRRRLEKIQTLTPAEVEDRQKNHTLPSTFYSSEAHLAGSENGWSVSQIEVPGDTTTNEPGDSLKTTLYKYHQDCRPFYVPVGSRSDGANG